jgi:hypothetical protein
MKRYLVVGVVLVALVGATTVYAAGGVVWSNAKLTHVLRREVRVNQVQGRRIAALKVKVRRLQKFQHCVATVATDQNPHTDLAAIAACAAK